MSLRSKYPCCFVSVLVFFPVLGGCTDNKQEGGKWSKVTVHGHFTGKEALPILAAAKGTRELDKILSYFLPSRQGKGASGGCRAAQEA